VGVSIERLTHDRYKWRGEDIANISTVAPAVQCYAKPKMRQLAGAAGCMLHKGLMMTSPLL